MLLQPYIKTNDHLRFCYLYSFVFTNIQKLYENNQRRNAQRPGVERRRRSFTKKDKEVAMIRLMLSLPDFSEQISTIPKLFENSKYFFEEEKRGHFIKNRAKFRKFRLPGQLAFFR